MEPIKDKDLVGVHLQQLREGLKDIEEETWPDDLLDRLLKSYEVLNNANLSGYDIEELVADFEEVNEKLEKLCQEHIFGGTSKEDQLLDRIHEFRRHIDTTVDNLFRETINPNDYLSQLPAELQMKVCDYLERSDMENVVAVSRRFRRVGQDPTLVDSKGVYSERLEKALREDPEVWKTPEFIEKYKNDLQNVTTLDLKKAITFDPENVNKPSPFPPDFIKFINDNCPNIKHFALPSNININHIYYLPKNLRSLKIDPFNKLTDDYLAEIAKLEYLNTLDIEGQSSIITAKGISYLRNLRHLENLNLTLVFNTSVVREPIGDIYPEIGKLESLKSLKIGKNNGISDYSRFGEIGKLPNLNHLNMEYTGLITDPEFSNILNLSSLRSLNLNGCWKLTDSIFLNINQLSNLTYLNLCGTKITDAGMAAVGELPNLSSLELSCSEITEAGIQVLAGLNNLTHVRMYRMNLTDGYIEELGNLENLEHLELHLCTLPESALEKIGKLENLKKLTLWACKGVTEEDIEILKEQLPNTKIKHYISKYR